MLITLTDLKTHLNITSSSEDTLLTACAARASAWFEAATRRTFSAAADTTRLFDAPPAAEPLWLDGDLCQLTQISNGDGQTIPLNAISTNPHSQPPYYSLELHPQAGVAWTYTSTPLAAISITGRWAYSVTAPPEVQAAVIRLAAWLYQQRDHSAAAPSIPAVGGLPADILALVELYRRRWA